MSNRALDSNPPRSFRRAIATVALAVGLIGAPASMMLGNATHAAAEVRPPDCFDDPNMPGCPGVGGGGGGEGGGMGDAGGGGRGGGHTGPAYRTFITDDDIASATRSAIEVYFDPAQWQYGSFDFVEALKTYWNAHSSDPVCVFTPGALCALNIPDPNATLSEPGLKRVHVDIYQLP